MWPSLIAKAKEGGLDVIQTYVFWNLHEPQPGQVSQIFSLSLSLSLSISCGDFVLRSMILVEDMIWCDSSKKSKHKGCMLALGLDLSLRVNGIMGTYVG